MTETFVFESYYIAFYHILSLFLLVFLNTYIYLKTIKGRLIYSFYILQAILALWIISKILKTFAPDADVKFFFVACQYAGVCFIGPAFINFSYIFAHGNKPSKKLMSPLLAISGILFIIVVTNPLHCLFYSHFDFWGDSFGPLFYLQQGYNYLLFTAGVVLCARKFFSEYAEKRMQAVLLAFAAVIPMFANIIYVSGYFKKFFGFFPPFDITPMSASASLIIFAFAAFKFQLFDNLKIARKAALSNIPEGIILVAGNKITWFNETFKKIAIHFENMHFKKSLKIGQKVFFPFDISVENDFIFSTRSNLYIRVICIPACSGSFTGAFIRFLDVTQRQQILKQLQQKNETLQYINNKLARQADIKKNLVAARTQNFIAQEAHDMLGHSIMLVISLLEIARMSCDNKTATEYSQKALKVLSQCVHDLNTSDFYQRNNNIGKLSIEEKLNTLAEKFSSPAITVEINCSNLKHKLTHQVEDAIFKLCREGITNALRHGNSSRVDIILRSKNKSTELFIIDNGKSSCGYFEKGMGIKGMEQRTYMLGGSIECYPLDSQGFCVHAVFPVISSNEMYR